MTVKNVNSTEADLKKSDPAGDTSDGSDENDVYENYRSFSADDAPTVDSTAVMNEGHRATIFFTLVRWVVTAIIGFGFFACLVASKISILSNAERMRIYKNTSNPIHDKHVIAGHVGQLDSSLETFSSDLLVSESEIVYGMESCILWLLILLLVPNIATLILALSSGACRHDRPWPAWSAITWVSLIYSTLCRHN